MTVILDTSFLFALTDRGDRNHNRVLRVAQNMNEPMLLPSVVLPEVCYLLASRLGHNVMRQFLGNLVASPIQLERITVMDLGRVYEILHLLFMSACGNPPSTTGVVGAGLRD